MLTAIEVPVFLVKFGLQFSSSTSLHKVMLKQCTVLVDFFFYINMYLYYEWLARSGSLVCTWFNNQLLVSLAHLESPWEAKYPNSAIHYWISWLFLRLVVAIWEFLCITVALLSFCVLRPVLISSVKMRHICFRLLFSTTLVWLHVISSLKVQ
jgi:hypothetical protein